MNKKELFKTSSQNGVTMYIDKSLNAVVDMDVEDWVTAIWFNSNVEMRDCDKKFPNVKKLIIGSLCTYRKFIKVRGRRRVT